MSDLLSQEEIVRELKRYRYDHSIRVPLKTFGEHVGLNRQSLCNYINGTMGMKPATRARLSKAILDIRAGRLSFVRRNQVWQVAGQAVEAI